MTCLLDKNRKVVSFDPEFGDYCELKFKIRPEKGLSIKRYIILNDFPDLIRELRQNKSIKIANIQDVICITRLESMYVITILEGGVLQDIRHNICDNMNIIYGHAQFCDGFQIESVKAKTQKIIKLLDELHLKNVV